MQNYRMLNGTINYIDGSKERIIEKWMSDNQITALFAKYEIGKEYFSKNIASHLFDIVVENIKTGSKKTISCFLPRAQHSCIPAISF